jgi:hypothetical protein
VRIAVRLEVAVLLVGCLFQAVAQAPADPSYGNFFNRVAREKTAPENPASSIQQSVGLSDREMTELRDIAIDCVNRLDAVSRQHERIVLDALFESIETGKDTSVERDERVKALNDQGARIVLAHTQALKAAFGDARFEALTAWLLADEASRPRMVKK